MTLKTDSIDIGNTCQILLRFELDSKLTADGHLGGIVK